MKYLILLLLIPTTTFANIDTKINEIWWKELGSIVIQQCNDFAVYPTHCKKIHSAIAKAESNLWKNTYRYNIYWNSKYKFNSYKEAIIQFNKTYLKYYWKARYNPSHFYSNNPKIKPITRYCMSEHSSNSSNYCPNGWKISWRVWNYLSN